MTAVQVVDSLLKKALLERASDIHIDPSKADTQVRFRVDGLLSLHMTLSAQVHSELISRIKVLARLRTDIHYLPQDGRCTYLDADVRVSIMPTSYGENAVLRILPIGATAHSLTDLGMSSFDCKRIDSVLKKQKGLILVTGPTGSGKTTTLYTLLELIKKSELSIITIEDPVEYTIEGIRQIQVNSVHGITFSNGLRSILRQDPDIIMVGEIRDTETAKIAIHSALTGHLVLSTLHTNSAVATVTRLFDMGIDPYLISETLSLVIAQRLVRKKAPSGFEGRIGIYETLIITPIVAGLINTKASGIDIENASGMKTMRADGLKKIKQGVTTREEIIDMLSE
jgi:type IV pilus assembly protein PilB